MAQITEQHDPLKDAQSENGAVTGGYRGRHQLRRRLMSLFTVKRFSKRTGVIIALVAVALIGLVAALFLRDTVFNRGEQYISLSEYSARVADEQSQVLSKESLSNEDRISVLQGVISSEVDAERYGRAKTRYEELMKLLGSRQLSDSATYLDGVVLYMKLNNKAAAERELEKAVAIDATIQDETLRQEAQLHTNYYRGQLR